MKRLFGTAALMLGLLAVSCKPEEIVPELVAPVASFTLNGAEADDVCNIAVDSTLTFEAEVANTDVFTCEWKLDDVKMASTEVFTYTFTEPGCFAVAFMAENEKGTAEKIFTVNVAGAPLEVSYSVEEEAIEVKINEKVEIAVNVLSGDKETVHNWKVDGVDASSEASVSTTFAEPGQYIINYFGINRDQMTASKQWTVTVKDLDMVVEYSPKETELETVTGTELSFKANVTAGVFGLTHSWTVNDAAVGTEAELKYTFAAAGEYTVTNVAANAQGDSRTHRWKIKVSDPVFPDPEPEDGVFIYDDFESSDLGVSSYYIGNEVGGKNVMSVVTNPYRTATNPSAKVLLDEASLITWASSGYFKFKINTFPDGKEFAAADRAKYDKVRFKVYLGSTGFTPILQEDAKGTRSLPSMINGVAFDPANPSVTEWNSAIKTNDWNVLVYDLKSPKYSSEVSNAAQTEQVQLRVSVNLSNATQTGADVYIDEIAFVEAAATEPDPGTDPDPVDPTPGSGGLFDDFESSALGVNPYYKGNNVGGVSVLQVVENPYKTSANSSSKVLVDKGSMMTNSSSGYFTFKINTYPDGREFPASERSSYTKFRVKVYVGSTGFTPLLQEDNKSTRSTPCEINGVTFNTASPSLDAWNAAIKTNDWNTFVYDITGPKYSTEVNNFAQTDQLQFRVFVDFNNTGHMGQDVFFDDFEFFGEETGGTEPDPGPGPGTDPDPQPGTDGLSFDNFEADAVGVKAYYKGNNVGGVSVLQVVENPYKTSVNNSSKVLVDKGSMMTNSSSGYFTFKINTYPDGTAISGETRAAYTKLRVKVYVGDTGFTPLLQEDKKSTRSTPCEINGVSFDTANPSLTAWNAAVKTNDWNIFVYDLSGPKYSTEVNNLSQTDQLQFRVFVDFNNTGHMGQDVFFDDFEFIQ
ncbi:MAG: PKD domain-containing protein [Bacteroidales bacterium]|nr:PKD domain-containing protein [Bacteroidales bacterium]